MVYPTPPGGASNATSMKRDHLSECGGCGSEERVLLYNVRHRGIYRRLCTNCVLKFHPGSFCPICFDVYDDSPAPHQRLMCFQCPSISHSSCVGFDASPRYQCPPCSNPSFVFFNVPSSVKKYKPPASDPPLRSDPTHREINKDSARALLAAARIASASMAKAANVARVEAERRVKEAALAKKRAKEALERLAYLTHKDNVKNLTLPRDSKAVVLVGGSVPLAGQKIKPKVGAAPSVQQPNPTLLGSDRIDKPRAAVSASTGACNTNSGPSKNGVSIEPRDIQNLSVKGDKDSNGLHSVSTPVAGQPQRQ